MPVAEMVCVVEGQGERDAVPIVIRRIAAEVDPGLAVIIPAIIRTPKSKLLKASELERAVELAARKLTGPGAILVLLDSDETCPARLGPEVLERARTARADVPLAVVLAKQEFEAWFIAAAASLRGVRGLPQDLEAPANPEDVGAAKAWLSTRMLTGNPYSESIDQPAFAAAFDLPLARRTDSFDKCHREIRRLLLGVMRG